MPLVLSGSSGLSGNVGTISRSMIGYPGAVLQVVNASTTSYVSTTAATFIATPLSATITPSSSTSKILVLGQIFLYANASTGQPNITVARNGSILVGAYGLGNLYTTAGGYTETVLPFSYVDSPGSTASLTYAIYGRNASTVNSVAFGDPARTSVITLMEISG